MRADSGFEASLAAPGTNGVTAPGTSARLGQLVASQAGSSGASWRSWVDRRSWRFYRPDCGPPPRG